MILCAAPTYLERHGAPEAPSDLTGHHWLGLDRETPETVVAAETTSSFLLHVDDGKGRHERIDLPIHVATTKGLSPDNRVTCLVVVG